MSFRRPPEWLLRGLLYTVGALVLTWPLILDPGGQVIGGTRSDLWNSIWGLWFASSHGVFPTETVLLDHPVGGRIALADPINAALAQPLLLFTDPVGAYGLLVIGHLAFAGFMADRLGVACGGRGWIAGVGYQLAPISLGCIQSGTSEAFSTGWLPLACLALIRALEQESRARALLAGLALALVALSSWYAGVGAWLFLLAVLALGWGGLDFRTRLLRLAPSMALALAISLPAASIVRGVATSEDGLVQIKDDVDLDRIRRTLGPSDPRSFITPGDFRSPDFASLQGNPSDYLHTTYLGFVLLGLALWSLYRGREPERTRAWWLAASLGAVLSLGPMLVMDGQPWALNERGLGLPLPYLLVEEVPGFSSLSLLFRLALISSLGLAVIADRAHPGWAILVGLEVLLLSPVRGLPQVDAAPDLSVLQAIDAPGAVLNLPPDASGMQLYEQTLHGQPITAALNTGLNGTALELLQAGRELRAEERSPEELAKMAQELSVRWVLLHRNVVLDDPWVSALTSFSEHGERVAQDENRELIRLRWPEDPPREPDP